MKRISKTLAVVLTLALLLSAFAAIPSNAETEPTRINNLGISYNSQYKITEVYVYPNSSFVKAYNELQSPANVTNSPSQELLDAMANCIKINDKTVAECMAGFQWWNAVRIYISSYGSNEMFTIQLYDAAFGDTAMYSQDFTIEFCDGALDGSCNPIAPHKYQYYAATHSYGDWVKPETTFSNMAIADFSDYGMSQLYLYTDAPYTADYGDMQSAANATGELSQEIVDTFSNYIKFNGKTIAQYVAEGNWYGYIRTYIGAYGETEMYTFYLYRAAFGGEMPSAQDFTFEILEGAKDTSGNPIKPAKYQYTAATGTFAEFAPEVEKTQVTGLNLIYHDDYDLSEMVIALDAAFVQQYEAINSIVADPIPPQALLNTVLNCILINGKPLSSFGGTIYSHLRSVDYEGEYQMFDIFLYDNVMTAPVYDNDFIIDIVEGATDSEGNPIEPCSYAYDAATHTFSEHIYNDVRVTALDVADQSGYDMTELYVLFDATDNVSYGEVQSAANATGEPSQRFMDSVANCILINDKSIKTLMEGHAWYNAVRVYVVNNGSNELFDMYLYDAAFGGHLFDEDFTVEFIEGAVDGVGNPITPCKYQYLADTQEFVPYTEPAAVTGLTIVDASNYGLAQLYIDLDSDCVTTYTNINSAIASPEPPAGLVNTVTEKILINGQSVNEIKTATGGAIWCNLHNYGGKQRIELQVYYGATGGISLANQHFTVSFANGAVDSEGKRIAGCKFQYNASSKSFSKYSASCNVIGVSVADASAYGLAQLFITTDASYSKTYTNINSGIADPTPSAELLNTVTNCIRINGQTVDEIKAATQAAIWCNLAASGNYQQFELQVYYGASGGTTLAGQDFTIEVLSGATNAEGGMIAPYKKQFNGATGTISDFNANTLVLMRKDLLGAQTNKTLDLNGDNEYDVRDLVHLKVMLAND